MSSITPSMSSPGIGSGLDVNTLVSQLVAAARAGQDKILSTKTSQTNAQISAVGQVKSALSNLQTSLTALTSSTGALYGHTAQSADSTVLSATASSAAVSGSYGVEVISLATAGKSASTAYANSSAAVGEGTVTINLGASAFTVTLGSSANSLSNLVSAINQASDNPGVAATIVTDVNGAHLMLTATKTGASNALSVSSAASGGGSLLTMNAIATAADAHIKVDGFDVYSASNTVSTAIDGLTMNLVKAQPGTSVLVSADVDQSAATKAVQDFVSNYNKALTTIATQTKADPTGANPGALVGDSNMRMLVNKLRTLVGSEISGTGSQWTLLSQLGITTNTDGTLKIDATQLGNAVKADFTSVQKLFSDSTNGLATQLTTALQGNVQTGGSLDSSTDNLNARLKDISSQQDLLNTRMSDLQARYLAQFSALDTLMATMKTTSTYLTQQLASLPGFSTQK